MRVLLLLFLAGLAYGQNIDANQLRQALETKCNNNADSEYAFEEVKRSFVDFQECSQSKLRRQPPNPLENHSLFCDYLRNNGVYGCVEDFIKVAAQCLDNSEKYLPHLLLHAINSTHEELCGPHGVANSNLLFKRITSSTGCSGFSGLAWSELACLSELNILKNLEAGMISFNKHDVCSDLDRLQSCMKSVVSLVCYNDEDPQIIDLIFTPYTEECNNFVRN